MNSDHAASTAEKVLLRTLLARAARAGLRFWILALIAGVLMALLAWPIPLVESFYIMAVWMPAIVLAPIVSATGDSFWEHWGWALGALAWLPLIVAFRFAHLVATHQRVTELSDTASASFPNGRNA